MILIGQNSTFIVSNNDAIALTVSIENNLPLPFITKLNKASSEKILELLNSKLDNVILNLYSSFLTNNCIDNNFKCNDYFFVKLDREIKIDIDNYSILIPFLSKYLEKNQAEYHINLSDFGIDFSDCNLLNGNYIIILANDAGNIYKQVDNINFNYAPQKKIRDASAFKTKNISVISKSIITDTCFIHTVVTRIHKKITIKTNVRGEIGSLKTENEENTLFEISNNLWRELNVKDNKILNILELIGANKLNALELELFIEENSNTEFIIQCEAILEKPIIRSHISHILL